MKLRKNLLYIGNKVAEHGKPPAAIDILSVWFTNEGYNVVTASSKKNKIFRMVDMILTTIINRKNTDLTIIDTYSTQNFYYAVIIAWLCRFFKIPYIPILHGGNLPSRLENSKSLSKNLFGGAKTNVAPSGYLLEKFKDYGFTNVTYIPNTIEIDKYPFRVREKIQAKLLWVRSFSNIYNPDLAIKIVNLLKQEGISVSLCMIGPDKDGSLERCKAEAERLNLDVQFTGKLEKKEWIALSKQYDIFINTTNLDNMPVSVMEAMALGLPVISTNVGGLPYLIENKTDGVLVPPKNAEIFVESIKALIENPIHSKTIALKARSKMETFDWEQVKHSWINLLEN